MEKIEIDDFDIDFEADDNYLGELDEDTNADALVEYLFGDDGTEFPNVATTNDFEAYLERLNLPRAVYEDHSLVLDTAFGVYSIENAGKEVLLPRLHQIMPMKDVLDKNSMGQTHKEIINLPVEFFNHRDGNEELTFEEIIERIKKPRIILNNEAYVLHNSNIYKIRDIGTDNVLLNIRKFVFKFDEIDNVVLALLIEMLREGC